MSAEARRPAESVPLQRVRPEHVAELARMLARAFEHDPFYAWLAPVPAERPWRLTRFFELLLESYSVDLSDTYATADLSACAIWKPPGDYSLSRWEQLRAMPAFARALGWSAMPRGVRLLDHLDALHARVAPAPHVYLYVLGVHPGRQGRGLASQLLKSRLERCDAEGHEVYLETANASNLPVYQRHGFVLRETAEHSKFPTLWCMTRQPRPR